MSIGLIGRKVGMTSVFQPDGTMVAVSVLSVEPNTVTRLRTTERDGYTAVQIGTEESKKLSKPERSEEHTSELQSQSNLVCRLLLEKKKTHYTTILYLSFH